MITHNIRREIRPSGVFASVAAILLLVAVSYVYFLLAGRIHGTDYYVNGVSPTNDSLRIHAYLPKSIFTKGEDIPLSVYLLNCSDRVVCIPREPYIIERHVFSVVCRDIYGSKLRGTEGTVHVDHIYPLSCDSLPPGDSVLITRNLNVLYGSRHYPAASLNVHPTGSFTAQAVLERDSHSDELQYRVVEPVGDDTLIYNWLCSLEPGYTQQQLRQAAPQIERMLKDFPQSVYIPVIIKLLIECYKTGTLDDNAKIVDYGKRLSEQYPDWRESTRAFYDVLGRMPIDEVNAYVLQIENAHPNTYVGRAATAHRLRAEKEAREKKPTR